MKLLATLVASCFLTLCALEADASVVNFTGTITTGGGGTAVLGTMPPGSPRDFTLRVTFNDGTVPNFLGTITGVAFDVQSPLQNFTVTSGNIVVTNTAGDDSAAFTVNVTGPAAGTLTFSFDRAGAITNNDANQTNVGAITDENIANFVANFGTAGVYAGHITGVPEPSSCLALLGLVGGGAWRWRRSRQQRATV